LIDPLTATATVTVVAVAFVGSVSAVWHLLRRVRRVETQAALLRRQLQAERHAANHDPLTGLPNRRGLFRLADPLLGDLAHRPLVAVVVDLDDFKQLNDRLGHAAGDEVLIAIARRFAGWAASGQRPDPAGDPRYDDPPGGGTPGRDGHGGCDGGAPTGRHVVARLGGDEFAGLLTTPTAAPGWLDHLAERLADTLGAPLEVAGHRVRVTASVGLAAVPATARLIDALREADTVMYRAKSHRHLVEVTPLDQAEAAPLLRAGNPRPARGGESAGWPAGPSTPSSAVRPAARWRPTTVADAPTGYTATGTVGAAGRPGRNGDRSASVRPGTPVSAP
jgi:GGDEF domain-containing protein